MDKPMKILVTGASGQLGADMIRLLTNSGCDVYGYGKSELDITDIEGVKSLLHMVLPDVVIHAAAYTKVDLAESECEDAFLINSFGTRNIAVIAEQIKAKLVYISTDYVFNGEKKTPLHEFEQTEPINIYGMSKLMGEHFVQSFHSRYFIVRTSWVYGQHGSNFVKTMLNLAKTHRQLTVVDDQTGCPTFTEDLAKCIHDLILTDKYGIYHVSNAGNCTWYEFAKVIFETAKMDVEVLPVSSEQFPRPAKRPSFSVFDHMSLRLNGFHEMRHWREALTEFIEKYNTVENQKISEEVG